MRKIFIAGCLILVASFFTMGASAQEDSATTKIKKAAKATGKAIGKGAKKVGNKTAELASKGSSEILDKTYDGKTGTEGQKIFINNKSQYYWVDDKGHRHYVNESELIEKKE